MRLPRFSFRPRLVSDWFAVGFDAEAVHLDCRPPRGVNWTETVAFAAIERVCFQCEPLAVSDGLYLFTSVRPESYVVPTEADGGLELLDELVRRGLFPAELAMEAASAPEGSQFCWPAED